MYRLKGERSISGAYHLLHGKRSAQTVQDAALFQVQPLFGICKEMTGPTLNQLTQTIQASTYVKADEGTFQFTESGLAYLKQWLHTHDYIKKINGWKYGLVAPLFWQRIALLVQTLANLHANERFIPVINDSHIQQSIKQMLPHHRNERRALQIQLYEEVKDLLGQQDPLHASMFVRQLSRPQRFGLSKPQLAYEYDMSLEQVQLRHTSTLHHMLKIASLSEGYPLIKQLAKQEQHVEGTVSAQKTAALLPHFQTVEQLAQKRSLKQSTIEDHLVELALLNSMFRIEPYVSDEVRVAIETIHEQEKTLKLKVIHDKLVGKASYFEIRLVLARKGLQSNVRT